MQKISVIIATFIVACLGFVSCDKDDDVKNEEFSYFIAVDKVETNLIDASGNNLSEELTNDAKALEKIFPSKNFTSDDRAIAAFSVSCNSFAKEFEKADFEMIEGSYIKYYFSLRKGSLTGESIFNYELEVKAEDTQNL